MTREQANRKYQLSDEINRINRKICYLRSKRVNTTTELIEMKRLKKILVDHEKELEKLEG